MIFWYVVSAILGSLAAIILSIPMYALWRLKRRLFVETPDSPPTNKCRDCEKEIDVSEGLQNATGLCPECMFKRLEESDK